MLKVGAFDHVGIRVLDRATAVAFYEKLGFRIDPAEDAPEFSGVGMVNDHGARIHLIYNAKSAHPSGNLLMDDKVKWPGYTHAAFIVPSMGESVQWLNEQKIPITEGPIVYGQGRRKTLFFRDPDHNVVEINEILKEE